MPTLNISFAPVIQADAVGRVHISIILSTTVWAHPQSSCWKKPTYTLTLMSGFDQPRRYTVAVHNVTESEAPDTPAETEKLLMEFLSEFRVGNEFIYRSVYQPSQFSSSKLPTERSCGPTVF